MRSPPPARGAFHNRFAGDHLLYGSGNGWWNNAADERGTIFVVPWRGGDVTSLGLSHPVDRIEVMGPDVLDSASQGETRSHGLKGATSVRAGTRSSLTRRNRRGPVSDRRRHQIHRGRRSR
jgi:hypothetical protein